MLGTGDCRMNLRDEGFNRLMGMTQRYDLSPNVHKLISNELKTCGKQNGVPADIANVNKGVAGVWVRGKESSYFKENPKQKSLYTYTPRSMGATDIAAMQARMVPIGDEQKIKDNLTRLAPVGARTKLIGNFAIISSAGQTDAQLTTIATRMNAYLDFLEKQYGVIRPETYMTVYLVANNSQLRKIANKNHNLDVSATTLGYHYPHDQSVVAVESGTLTGTLQHELFHMLVRSNFGDVPLWLDEGIAELYEQTNGPEQNGRFVGVKNWRGSNVLVKSWPYHPKLIDVISKPWSVTDSISSIEPETTSSSASYAAASNFAIARYFALWLQHTGKLVPVYQAIQAIELDQNKDPIAAQINAIEKVIGPLAEAQVKFNQWFLLVHPETPQG
jgi:hypothetical protein